MGVSDNIRGHHRLFGGGENPFDPLVIVENVKKTFVHEGHAVPILKGKGLISESDEVVLFNTGSGLKYVGMTPVD